MRVRTGDSHNGRVREIAGCPSLISVGIKTPGQANPFTLVYDGDHEERAGQLQYSPGHLQAQWTGYCRQCLQPGKLRSEPKISYNRQGCPMRKRGFLQKVRAAA